MKKFILPLTVIALAAGMQFTSLETKFSTEKNAATKQTTVDIGTFVYNSVNYEAYGIASTHKVTTLVPVGGSAIAATGTYTTAVGDQGTINVSFTVNNVLVHYSGVYYV